MPIAWPTLIDSANSPNVGSYTLAIGVDMPLYITTAGYFQGSANGAVFGIPPQSSIPRGTLWIEAVPNAAPGGTGAISLALQASFDGGTTFQTVQAAQAAWTAGAGTIISLNVSGLGGCGSLRLVSSGVTLGTATGFNIYAHLG